MESDCDIVNTIPLLRRCISESESELSREIPLRTNKRRRVSDFGYVQRGYERDVRLRELEGGGCL